MYSMLVCVCVCVCLCVASVLAQEAFTVFVKCRFVLTVSGPFEVTFTDECCFCLVDPVSGLQRTTELADHDSYGDLTAISKL